MRKRTSVVWQCSDEDFRKMVKESPTMSFLLRHFGLENKGGNYQTCKARIKELGLDTSHFLSKLDSSHFTKRMTEEKFLTKLVINSCFNRSHLKRYLIKFNLLSYICHKCGNIGEWQDERLSLQLEHKNGISNDNRLENLEFLCPNCHSQTKTFAGKRHKKYRIKPSQLNPNWRHAPKEKNRKFIRPSREELEVKLKELNILSLSKFYGVKSDNTIRKWAKFYGLDWKQISPFSHVNRKRKEKIITFHPKSEYKYVSYDSKRCIWSAHIKDKNKKSIFFKRFKIEDDAAKAISDYFKSETLILR